MINKSDGVLLLSILCIILVFTIGFFFYELNGVKSNIEQPKVSTSPCDIGGEENEIVIDWRSVGGGCDVFIYVGGGEDD